MEDFKNYIVPIVEHSPKGCGFLIPNYFITAGHIFDDTDTISIIYKGEYYSFHKSDAVYLETPKVGLSSEEAQDIAVFKFQFNNSPLRLCKSLPNLNTLLKCYSLIPVTDKDPYTLLVTNCKVTRTLYNFFECTTDITLKEGTSGSPLIDDNIVYGILSGCLDPLNNPETILFFPTKQLPIK